MADEEIRGNEITKEQVEEVRDDLIGAAKAIQEFDQDEEKNLDKLRGHLKRWVWRGGG